MAAVPTVPSFVTGETPSIAKLNQLAACVSFVNYIPAFASMTASQSMSSGSAAALSWTEGTDRDGGHSNSTNPTRYTAQTPGYYDLDAYLNFEENSSGARLAYFQVTTGSGNPGGAGNVTQLGAKSSAASNSTPTRLNLGILSPYLYTGDYVEVYAEQTSGSTLNPVSGYWQLALVSLGP